jgi:hypothetical protein
MSNDSNVSKMLLRVTSYARNTLQFDGQRAKRQRAVEIYTGRDQARLWGASGESSGEKGSDHRVSRRVESGGSDMSGALPR